MRTSKLKTYKLKCQNPTCGKEFEFISYGGVLKKCCCDECHKEYTKIKQREYNHNHYVKVHGESAAKKRAMNSAIKALKSGNEVSPENAKLLSPEEQKFVKILAVRAKRNEVIRHERARRAKSKLTPEQSKKRDEERKERLSKLRKEVAIRQRKASIAKHRAEVQHIIDAARATGKTIGIAICEDCHEEFEYVVEDFKSQGGLKVPRFCSDTCRVHTNYAKYSSKYKNRYKSSSVGTVDTDGEIIEKEKKMTQCVTYFRGSGFYGSQIRSSTSFDERRLESRLHDLEDQTSIAGYGEVED